MRFSKVTLNGMMNGFLVGALCWGAWVFCGAEAPAVFSISGKVLEERAEALKAGDAGLNAALESLVKQADKDLAMKPVSVMSKELLPPSGDKHDYYSFGIYWWPDPSKPDGLPYLRKDGERNPDTRKGNDGDAFAKTNRAVSTLGLAYFFTGKEVYAKKAAELTRVWYLNAETRMNPNMNHAQAVPGRNDGRSVGLIEASSMPAFMDGIALIRSSGAWTEPDDAALTKWLADFYEWLRTSENGTGQEKATNNHGTYYDALAGHLELYLGKETAARERLEKALSRRLDKQVRADGKQPHELKRTISYSYTVFNLEAFFQLAVLGESVGVDWWSYRGPKGQSLKAALDLLVPYLDDAKKWDLGKQIKKENRRSILPMMQQALRYEDLPEYRDALERYGRDAARWKLVR